MRGLLVQRALAVAVELLDLAPARSGSSPSRNAPIAAMSVWRSSIMSVMPGIAASLSHPGRSPHVQID